MFQGIVKEGKKHGRELGFPTANIEVSFDDVDLADGVYAAHVFVEETTYLGALVVWQEKNMVEVHILGFDEDIYTKVIAVEAVKKVSDMVKLDSLEALKKKISEDIEKVRSVFA